MDFVAASLYPSAMWDEKSVFPKREMGYDFSTNMRMRIRKNLILKALHEVVLF